MPYFVALLWKTDITSLSENELWRHYERCLAAHDWTYEDSDDHNVWLAGMEQSNHLLRVRQAVSKLDKQRADSLYNEKCPWIEENCS